ncbi:hypothetical protein [Bradyrhizobium sp. Tv2a-2]|uniref:hypothetical protein n=1 Tax=Bradyrhizobium sp. Tv2a-2 TaxID=113395 RepID=UPI0003FAE3F0|nr:hypothetical protein [Bradyrhizobium sp. Tv2a-2]
MSLTLTLTAADGSTHQVTLPPPTVMRMPFRTIVWQASGFAERPFHVFYPRFLGTAK